MIKFLSLKPSGLPSEYDASLHGEEPVITIEEKNDEIQLSYIFPGFSVSDDDHDLKGDQIPFKEVGISGAGFISESGKPLLPSFGRYVQIPHGCDFEVKVKKNRGVKFEDMVITPAQEKATDSSDSNFEFDEDSYTMDKYYPEEIVNVSGPYDMDDYLVLAVHVRPLVYNPVKKLLRGYSNITVEIKLIPKDELDTQDSSEYSFLTPPTNKEGFGNLIFNPRRRIGERMKVKIPNTELRPRLFSPELLIIYAEDLAAPARKLTKWKIKRGIRTEMIPINRIGNTAGNIKNHIRRMRNSLFSPLRYVLLFGDVG